MIDGTKYKIQTGSSGGGTQLYKHLVNANDPNIYIIVTNTESNQFAGVEDLLQGMYNAISIYFFDEGTSEKYTVFCNFKPNILESIFYKIVDNTIMEFNIFNFFGDNVTAL